MPGLVFDFYIAVDDFLDQLNESQREAVVYTDGPSLVIAGAGSGKTRVLTYKVAYLLKLGFAPYSILALTFTNKAAREMKERVASLAGEITASRIWMGTFHSIFARILRNEASLLGYKSSFTIYDAADSKSLIKSIIKEMGLDDKVYRPGMIQGRISNAKNALITCNAYSSNREIMQGDINAKVPLIKEIYERYQSRCFQADAMDFDDLLLQTNILFRDHPDVLQKYVNFFKYVLVDEYQDTNFAQHLIIRRLCENSGHICVVGDDAQSIYSFRGANIDNILQFKNIYPGCRIFKLERNYRSTQNIVNAANSLIAKNERQISKNIYSEKETGNKLRVLSYSSDYEEAYAVASRIASMQRHTGNYADFAVLYRTNAQSRLLEEALRKRTMPYRIYGGTSFYQRKEIKDAISYFRLVINPDDEEALKRVINYPTRGIGQTTLDKLIDAANRNHVSIWTIIGNPANFGVQINGGTAKKISDFREMIQTFIIHDEGYNAEQLSEEIVAQSGMMKTLMDDRSVEGISKQENLQELLKGIAEFCEIRREEGMEQIRMQDYLSEVVLLTDQDDLKDEVKEKVTLMTVHAAKGLEFKHVFVVGMEENLFPSIMSLDSQRAVEEERRLFYVAITRAEQTCTLTYAKSRFRNGKSDVCSPSRFLKDIDSKYLEVSAEESQAEDPFASARRQYGSHASRSFEPSFDTSLPRHLSQMTKLETKSAKDETVKSEPLQSANGLSVGMRVSHARFGQGKITAMENAGGDTKATVVFDSFGQKTLLLKYAKLTVIG